jgi:hypothetical protein
LNETSRKERLKEAEITLRREETARKRKHLSEKELEDKVRVHPEPIEFLYPSLSLMSRTRQRQSIAS